MEDLNKNQFILLVLLISFVTSIATGIMTTSLLEQAPVEVTRNINSIVEKTIQTVVPSTVTPSTGQKEVTTVVVKEEDLIISSINKNVKSIVRINATNTLTGDAEFYGIGLVVAKDGSIAADRKSISSLNKYIATMSDGTQFVLTPAGLDKQTNFILFKTATTSLTKTPYSFVPATFSSEDPQLGQTMISLGGNQMNAVAVGRVTSIDTKDTTIGTSTAKSLAGIDTDVSTKDLVDGSPVFNLSGDLVGIKLTSDPLKSFTSVYILKKELPGLNDQSKV